MLCFPLSLSVAHVLLGDFAPLISHFCIDLPAVCRLLCSGEDMLLIFTLVFNIEYQNARMKKRNTSRKSSNRVWDWLSSRIDGIIKTSVFPNFNNLLMQVQNLLDFCSINVLASPPYFLHCCSRISFDPLFFHWTTASFFSKQAPWGLESV